MVLGYPPVTAKSIADHLNCQLGSFPTSCMGIPISDSRLSLAELQPTVAKLQPRIEPWQGRWLSKDARTVLINSSVSSLLLFLMRFYSLPENLHHEIATAQARFFWAGDGDKQKYHMVRWSKICKPRDQGGLGIMSSKCMNISLLTHWIWRISRGEGGLWLHIIQNKYLRTQLLAFCERSGGSQFWKSLIQLLPVLCIGTSIEVGSGASTMFWFDRWAGESAFAARFPALFSIADVPRISVEEALMDLGRLAFRRPFGPMDTLTWQDLLESIALHAPDLDRPDDRISWRLEPLGCFSMKSLY
ncbi:ABC transporter G family member 37 [Hordeum vulgare]|nr:ABC transporter G family member 37 [Hordeum vulgare]